MVIKYFFILFILSGINFDMRAQENDSIDYDFGVYIPNVDLGLSQKNIKFFRALSLETMSIVINAIEQDENMELIKKTYEKLHEWDEIMYFNHRSQLYWNVNFGSKELRMISFSSEYNSYYHEVLNECEVNFIQTQNKNGDLCYKTQGMLIQFSTHNSEDNTMKFYVVTVTFFPN